MARRRAETGASMIAVIFLIVVVGFFGVIVVSLSATHQITALNELQSTQALFVAEAGLDRAVNLLLAPSLGGRVLCANAALPLPPPPALPIVAFTPGQFTLNRETNSPFYPAAPTTIQPNPGPGISAVDTTIAVASTAGYAPFGRIMIDRELIDYTGTTPAPGASFTGAIRGRDGTTATAHAAGTRVGQDQCTVTSTGGVVDLSAGARGRRVVRAGLQLQEGWMVGRNSGGEVIVRWDGVNWVRSGPVAGIPNVDLNAVSMLSYAEGWIVGEASGGEVILRWTGGPNWVRVGPVAGVPDVDLWGVFCVSANDCWAVGDPNGGEVILRWTGGPDWTRFPANPAIPNTTLRSVHCVTTIACWAVGDASGGEVILQWTGGPTWNRVGPIGAIPDVDLYSVFCVMGNDCWAVGDRSGGEVILRWTGGPNWIRVGPVAGVPDTLLRSVFCLSTADCWAVGDRSGGSEVLLRWTGGPNWVRVGPSLPVPNVDLYSVWCLTSTDCWTTGSTSAGNDMLAHWDGSVWLRVGPLAGVPNTRMLGASFLGAKWRPQAVWREVVN